MPFRRALGKRISNRLTVLRMNQNRIERESNQLPGKEAFSYRLSLFSSPHLTT